MSSGKRQCNFGSSHFQRHGTPFFVSEDPSPEGAQLGSKLPHELSSFLFRLNCCSYILSMVRTANEMCPEGDFSRLPPRYGVVKEKKKSTPLHGSAPRGGGCLHKEQGLPPQGYTEGITVYGSTTAILTHVLGSPCLGFPYPKCLMFSFVFAALVVVTK